MQHPFWIFQPTIPSFKIYLTRININSYTRFILHSEKIFLLLYFRETILSIDICFNTRDEMLFNLISVSFSTFTIQFMFHVYGTLNCTNLFLFFHKKNRVLRTICPIIKSNDIQFRNFWRGLSFCNVTVEPDGANSIRVIWNQL